MTATLNDNLLRDRLTPAADLKVGELRRSDEAAAPRNAALHRTPEALNIEAVILLAGSVRRNELVEATGRARLDLPLDERETVLNQWQRQTADWLKSAGQGERPLRVLIDRVAPVLPRSAVAIPGAPLSIETDPQECRGTGGLLRDLAVDFDDESWLLVATGAQVLLEPLAALVVRLSAVEGDVRLLAHADGTPVGIMLVRCGCLRKLDRIGFVDMKEQALPRIAKSHRVGVVMCNNPTSLPLLTYRDYLRAMRQCHLRRSNPQVLHDPFAEDWRCGFGVIEPGAQIDGSVHLHDSVVLRAARVEAGATVVRSVVCSGAVIKRNQVVIDQLVEPHGASSRA